MKVRVTCYMELDGEIVRPGCELELSAAQAEELVGQNLAEALEPKPAQKVKPSAKRN